MIKMNEFVDIILRTVITDPRYKEESKIIMEVGLGEGKFFLPLSKKSPKNVYLIGVDISQSKLNDLKDKIKNTKVNLYEVDSRYSGFFKQFEGKINTIYSFAEFSGFYHECWQRRSLDNLINSLTLDGRLILGEKTNNVFHKDRISAKRYIRSKGLWQKTLEIKRDTSDSSIELNIFRRDNYIK